MNTTDRRVLVIGATGVSGTLISRNLAAAGIPLTLAARRITPLQDLAHTLAATAVTDFDLTDPDRAVLSAAAVVNAAGPFTGTTSALVRACLRSGVPYIDIANEFTAVHELLELDDDARAAGVPLVTGAGFGPAISESLLRQLLPTLTTTPRAVRVVCAPAAETLSPAVQATVTQAIAHGATRYVDGTLSSSPFGSGQIHITFGGHDWTVLPAPTADLDVAHRLTAAPEVTAYFAAPGNRPAAPTPTSYVHIEIDTATETFTRTVALGRGAEATAAIAATLTLRLLDSDLATIAGAWTPGALFGPELAADAADIRHLTTGTAGLPR
ncbi:saccharopine dehydrogenase NADP-binding domain-containing protein [Nocardia noduli]|uniref:saccharopine dehydrogenase NADP-binding domain-containing protein n=1 Tax=Nocardia noduli TaxID=2815722 RepID=UPI001C24F243|nr:saccharopine dehydrogenase NADP-binding domain-containing protein [Nocardia noduli]